MLKRDGDSNLRAPIQVQQRFTTGAMAGTQDSFMMVGGEATVTGGSTGSPQSTPTMQEAGKNDEEQQENTTGPAADQGGDAAAGAGQTKIDDPPGTPP